MISHSAVFVHPGCQPVVAMRPLSELATDQDIVTLIHRQLCAADGLRLARTSKVWRDVSHDVWRWGGTEGLAALLNAYASRGNFKHRDVLDRIDGVYDAIDAMRIKELRAKYDEVLSMLERKTFEEKPRQWRTGDPVIKLTGVGWEETRALSVARSK